MTASPSHHDAVTMACPVCHTPFPPHGRRRFCSDACKATAYRRRRNPGPAPVIVPAGRRRGPITVYECDDCGARALGDQRCNECSTFMRRVGYGGPCPHCDEPVAVTDLIDQEAAP